MAGLQTLAKLAGVEIPGPVRFAINPTGYILGEIFKKIESTTGMPSNSLETLSNPGDALRDYLKTEAGNAIFDQSNTSRIEQIINELQPNMFEQARAAGQTPDMVPSSITNPYTQPDQLIGINGIDLPAAFSLYNSSYNPSAGIKGYTDAQGDYHSFASASSLNDGGYCPAPWINILLADGGTVKAGDIKPGMEVYTRHETTKEWGVYPVSAVEMSEDERWEVLLEDGRSFVGSPNHRVHTGEDWIEIHALKAGDKLVQPEGFGVVKSSAKFDHGPVVKITVADAHTYISEGFLSHNVKMMDFGGGGVGGGGINFDDVIEQLASYATGGKIYTSKR